MLSICGLKLPINKRACSRTLRILLQNENVTLIVYATGGGGSWSYGPCGQFGLIGLLKTSFKDRKIKKSVKPCIAIELPIAYWIAYWIALSASFPGCPLRCPLDNSLILCYEVAPLGYQEGTLGAKYCIPTTKSILGPMGNTIGNSMGNSIKNTFKKVACWIKYKMK